MGDRSWGLQLLNYVKELQMAVFFMQFLKRKSALLCSLSLDFFQEIANFADSFTNCLLFVHYLSLVMLELRHLQTMYVLEVIRTTDGERKFYNVGDLRYFFFFFFFFFLSHVIVALVFILVNYMHHRRWPGCASNPRI